VKSVRREHVSAYTADNGWDAVTGDYESLTEAMMDAANYAREEGCALR
jgi:hypothetical protein